MGAAQIYKRCPLSCRSGVTPDCRKARGAQQPHCPRPLSPLLCSLMFRAEPRGRCGAGPRPRDISPLPLPGRPRPGQCPRPGPRLEGDWPNQLLLAYLPSLRHRGLLPLHRQPGRALARLGNPGWKGASCEWLGPMAGCPASPARLGVYPSLLPSLLCLWVKSCCLDPP